MNEDFVFGVFISSMIGALIGFVIGALIGGRIAGLSTKNSYEQAAVANNCGHYVVNQEGDVVFSWKKEKIDE